MPASSWHEANFAWSALYTNLMFGLVAKLLHMDGIKCKPAWYIRQFCFVVSGISRDKLFVTRSCHLCDAPKLGSGDMSTSLGHPKELQ